MEEYKALGYIREARASIKDEWEANSSRELAIVITKLDEAEMWFNQDIKLKKSTINEHNDKGEKV